MSYSIVLPEDVSFGHKELKLELANPLRGKEREVRGSEMCRRFELNSNLAGKSHAERLLDDQQSSIPKKWRQFLLIFLGDVWYDQDGRLTVRCLSYYDRDPRWYLKNNWLTYNLKTWGASSRVVLFEKPRQETKLIFGK